MWWIALLVVWLVLLGFALALAAAAHRATAAEERRLRQRTPEPSPALPDDARPQGARAAPVPRSRRALARLRRLTDTVHHR